MSDRIVNKIKIEENIFVFINSDYYDDDDDEPEFDIESLTKN